MKKFFSAISLLSILVVIIMPFTVLAVQGAPEACEISARNIERMNNNTDLQCTAGVCNFTNSKCGMCCLLNTFYTITDWIFFFLIGLAVIFVIVAGFHFLFSGGSPEKTLMARNYLIYAAVGIAVGLLARAIPSLVKMLTGV
ncbi:MAG: hypothetical protein PHF44_01565 [Candidatus Pacebacteria bacterium]|nr:hypothetical protein [Candidatus Paceibacterota bacterium]